MARNQQPSEVYLVTDIINPNQNQRFPPLENAFRDYFRFGHFLMTYLVNKPDNENADKAVVLLLHEGEDYLENSQPRLNKYSAMTFRSCLNSSFSLIQKYTADNLSLNLLES